jgi:hypothetical protein
MAKYSGRWTANLSAENRQNFDEMLSNSKIILDRLKEICYNMVNELETKVSNDYDNPNWALRTADSVGYKRALERVIMLLTPADEKKGP